MDLKKKLRRFFTLTHKANDGFTLVELVIVIAILAILGGAAVPVYNGYTRKAREAADQMIVAAANDAFEAACMENKVDAMDVSEAAVSVLEGKVYGLSSATYGSDTKFVDKTAPYFLTYYAGNEDMTFQTPGINSLIWNDTLDSFEMKEDFVDTRIVLANGKTLVVSAEDMALIMASAYADMGAAEVTAAINNVGKSGEALSGLINFVDRWGVLGLRDKMSAVLVTNGLIESTDEGKKLSASQTGNGLQMVTAKYLASADAEDIEYLLNKVQLTDSTAMLKGLTGDAGGTRTVAAAALQYALVEAYANSDAANGQTITYNEKVWNPDKYGILGGGYDEVPTTVTVSDYLATQQAIDDPIKALATVQATAGYTNYSNTDQYQKDIDGFVGTMSILGDNLGTTNNPGSIDINNYFNSGVNSQDAQDTLTAVLGK